MTRTKSKKSAGSNGQPVTSTHPLARCRPRDDRVVIKRDLPKDKSEGGILLAETSQGKQQTGTVIRIGPGKRGPDGKRIPIEDLKDGDQVILTGYAGMEIRDGLSRENDEYLILREEDIVANL